jgi:predicted secreted protein
MMRIAVRWLLVLGATPFAALAADVPSAQSLSAQPPSVTVTGAATATIPNDRMFASVRAEAEAPTAAAAANDVNAKIAQATTVAKAVSGVEVRSAGYSTWQVSEKGRPSRWRVVQSITLEGSDFARMAALLTRLQEDGLLLSGTSFGVRTDTRRQAEDALTQQAIRTWQQRAEVAASALGYVGWRPGRVVVNTGDAPFRPEPMMRAQAMAAPAPVSPLAFEGGTTDITVTVAGDAVLEKTPIR